MGSVELSNTYVEKVAACKSAIEALGAQLEELIDRYREQRFPGSEVGKSTVMESVMQGKLPRAVFEYMTRMCDLPYLRDRRAPHEYAVDLVLGWLVEDAIVRQLVVSAPGTVLTGHDRFREFLSPQKISTQPDIRIGPVDGPRLLEIFCDWSNTWRGKGHADLRDSKFDRLVGEQALLVGVAPHTIEGFLLDLGEDRGGFEAGFIAGYRKPGYTTKRIRSYLRPLHEVMDQVQRIAADLEAS